MKRLLVRPKYYENFDVCKNLYIAGINTPAKVEKYSKYDGLLSLTSYAYEIFRELICKCFDSFVRLSCFQLVI